MRGCLFNDQFSKLVKNDTPEKIYPMRDEILTMESRTGDAYDLSECPDFAIEVFEGFSHAAKALALVINVVAMGFASGHNLAHED